MDGGNNEVCPKERKGLESLICENEGKEEGREPKELETERKRKVGRRVGPTTKWFASRESSSAVELKERNE